MSQININFIQQFKDTFIVGGTVRDFLLGNPPTDWDLVTFGDPERLARRIAEKYQGRMVALGKPGKIIFRVVTKTGPSMPNASITAASPTVTIDIAPVNGKTICEDLAKRDFTINAMAISSDNGMLIDTQNGEKDLIRKKIRMISRQNLKDDPLRLLRAYRFAAALDFTIDPETSRAITAEAFRIHIAAPERMRDELIKLMTTPRARAFVKLMDDHGLLEAIFPELAHLKNCSQNTHHQYDVFEHTMKAFGFLEKLIHSQASLPTVMEPITPFLPPAARFPLLKMAILLHDIGKPAAMSTDDAGRIHFYGHEKIGAGMARDITRRLRFSNSAQEYIEFIIRHHIRPLSLFIAERSHQLSPKTLTRFFMKSGTLTRDLLVHSAADICGKGLPETQQEFIEFVSKTLLIHTENYLPRKSGSPLVTGHDLIQVFGLTPSPRFAEILTRIEEERLAGTMDTRAQALDQIKKMLRTE